MCWFRFSLSLRIVCMPQQQQHHIRIRRFIIIVFITLNFKLLFHDAKVRRFPHSHNPTFVAFAYHIYGISLILLPCQPNVRRVSFFLQPAVSSIEAAYVPFERVFF